MPKINLLPKKNREPKPRRNTPKRELRQKAYRSTKWRKVRLTYLVDHPMCEICEHNPAIDVHHIQSFIVDNEIDWGLLLDSNNLKALCKDCHAETHNRQQGLNTVSSTIERLNQLLNKEN
jgi:5-methylcytosine-specific restriction protein A